MVWRCRRQPVHRFYLRCYKKDFGEKWSRTRYRFRNPIPHKLKGRENRKIADKKSTFQQQANSDYGSGRTADIFRTVENSISPSEFEHH